MKFIAPKDAPAHRALLTAAAGAGLDVEALRDLLWLINAHPDLIAHARVFGNLLAHFESDLCLADNLDWADPWAKEWLPEWIVICRWVARERQSLALLSGLEQLDRQPKARKRLSSRSVSEDHPLLSRGISRHPLVGALWSTHQTTPSYPLPDNAMEAGRAYFHLQTQVLLAHITYRYRSTTRDVYESYAGEKEDVSATPSAAGVGVALRELTYSRLYPLLRQYPVQLSPPEFAKRMKTFSPDLDAVERDDLDDAERYSANIASYCARLESSRSPRRRQRGPRQSSSEGGRQWRSGYIHYPETSDIYIRHADPKPEDDDLPYTAAVDILIGTGAPDDDPMAAERSGLAPEDVLEPVFRLYAPEDIGRRLASKRYQQLAVEAASQHLPFAWSRLTDTELRQLEAVLDDAVNALLGSRASLSSSVSYRGRAALILKVMLYFGHTLESARQMEFAQSQGVDEGKVPRVERITLLFESAGANPLENASVAGILLPALSPGYVTRLDRSLESWNRPQARSLLLSDCLGLGEQLLAWLRIADRPDNKIFGMESGTTLKYTTEILAELNDSRITRDKLSMTVRSLTIDVTRDPSLAWCLTADASRANEPRMFYTRHATDRLRAVQHQVSALLAHSLGKPTPLPALEQHPQNRLYSVGARFVATRSAVTDLIARLRSELVVPAITLVTRERRLAYHNSFILYSWLLQSLASSMRAIRRPNHLYRQWREAEQAHSPILAGLSDKETIYSERSRLSFIGPMLHAQFGYLRRHLESMTAAPVDFGLTHSQDPDHPFVSLSPAGKPEPLTPGWVEGQLEKRQIPLPGNFHRAFLRTELLAQGVLAEVVDAALGHARIGESPFGHHSSFDYGHYIATASKAFDELHQSIGLKAIPSRLVHHTRRWAT